MKRAGDLAAWTVGLAALSIEHTPPDCVLQGRFSKVVARVAPALDVAAVRVELVRGEAANPCTVEMKTDAPSFAAVLPPAAPGADVRYSIVAVDRAGAESRVGPFLARAVLEPAACNGSVAPSAPRGPLPTCASAAVATQAPAPSKAPEKPREKEREVRAAKASGVAPEVSTCLTAHGLPLVTARLAPGAAASEARVYFGANAGADLCYVEMSDHGDGTFGALLPKPDEGEPAPPFYVWARYRSGKVGRTAELRASGVPVCVPPGDPSTRAPFVPIVCPGGAFR
jgi:hypothetical protein